MDVGNDNWKPTPFGCLFGAIFIVCITFIPIGLGVIVWAIIRVVQAYT